MKENQVIVWGTGAGAQEFITMFGMKHILCFADNNEQLWGKTYKNREILSMKQILMLPHKYLIIISTIKYEQEIKEQLIANGYNFFMNVTQYRIEKIFSGSHQKEQRIILLNTHDHINIGDHLITIAELFFFRKYLPKYELIEIPLTLCSVGLEYIHHHICKSDLLVVTGGGFLGSLYLVGGENNVREIVRQFPDNRIIVFPQTMYFEADIEGDKQKKISKKIYNAHKNLVFCFRDINSYELGLALFSAHVKKIYMPDMATLLDRSDEIFLRDGILLCIRKDSEGVLPEKYVHELKKELKKKGFKIKETSMLETENIRLEDRMDAVNAKLRQIQTSQVVITDRLHCMLLCAISGTPCLAFDNLSGKVVGVYHWIKENPYIRLVENRAVVWDEIQKLLDMNYMIYCNRNIDKFHKLAEFIKSWEM